MLWTTSYLLQVSLTDVCLLAASGLVSHATIKSQYSNALLITAIAIVHLELYPKYSVDWLKKLYYTDRQHPFVSGLGVLELTQVS